MSLVRGGDAASDILARLETVLPRFEELLDRDTFLRRVRDHGTRFDGHLNPSRRVAEFILLLDGPPSLEPTERRIDLHERASGNDTMAARLLEWSQRYHETLGAQP